MVNFPLITFNALTKLKKAGFTHIRDQLASELTQIKSATPPDNKSLLNFGSKLEIYSFLATEPLLSEILNSVIDLKQNPEKHLIKLRQQLFPNNMAGLSQNFQATSISHVPIFKSHLEIERDKSTDNSYFINLYLENRQTNRNYINKISLPLIGYDAELGNGVYINIFDTNIHGLSGVDFARHLLEKSG